MAEQDTKETKITLKMVITEALNQIGHTVGQCYDNGDGSGTMYVTPPCLFDNYEISYNDATKEVKFNKGCMPIFDFYEPDSIMLFKAAAMQMSTMLMLSSIRDRINDLVGY